MSMGTPTALETLPIDAPHHHSRISGHSAASQTSLPEVQLIGSILDDVDPIEKPHLTGSMEYPKPNRYPMAESPSYQSFARATSAPPQLSLDTSSLLVNGENISSEDPRLSPAYYAYYYSQRPLDPRLPPPLLDYSTWGSSGNPSFSPDTFKHMRLPAPKPSMPKPVSLNGWSSEKSFGASMIQYDFPRTPSPLFPVTSGKLGTDSADKLDKDQHVQQLNTGGPQQPQYQGGNLQSSSGSTPSQAYIQGIPIPFETNSFPRPDRPIGLIADIEQQLYQLNIADSKQIPPNSAGVTIHHQPSRNRSHEIDPHFNSNSASKPQFTAQQMTSPISFGRLPFDDGSRLVSAKPPPPTLPIYPGQHMFPPHYSAQHSTLQYWDNDLSRHQHAHQPVYYHPPQHPSNYVPAGGGAPYSSRISTVGGSNATHVQIHRSVKQHPHSGSRNVQVISASPHAVIDRTSILHELRSNKHGHTVRLNDVIQHRLVADLATDQNGSRFIQMHLEQASDAQKQSLYEQLEPEAIRLCVDVFGNYVIQKFFEFGLQSHRRGLAEMMRGSILSLSMQMYGCRVVQKALDVIEPDQQILLVNELQSHVEICVKDQNGNHVIQKCIEKLHHASIQFIVEAFIGNVYAFSTHAYGCRVIQRLLEYCTDPDKLAILIGEILCRVVDLIGDQYGNYVIQNLIERGDNRLRDTIVAQIKGRVCEFSCHKFASNVIEKCFLFGSEEDKELLVQEIIGGPTADGLADDCPLGRMVKDQYANYVVQKIFGVVTVDQRNRIVERIRTAVPNVRKIAFGKHIVATIERLTGKVL